MPDAWSNITTYVVGDTVASGGNAYYCIANNINQSPPNPARWRLLGPTSGLYDTTLFATPAPTYFNNFGGLSGVQVTLRVWDNKTRQTRQVTIVQDL